MVKIALYNDSGKLITKSDLKLSDASFGKQYPDGRIIVIWSGENNDHDGNGFDKHHLEDNGEHTKVVLLKKGTVIARYGSPGGRFTTDSQSDYSKLSLPYARESIEYHQYEVLSDQLPVLCYVTRGRVAPMFDSPGGAVQYMHEQKISLEIEDGKIQEVFTWL